VSLGQGITVGNLKGVLGVIELCTCVLFEI